jgi:formylaminopyrimidine deformylase / aminopyrimidine aminohydrolase
MQLRTALDATTTTLVASAANYWSRVTGHPFLAAIARGALDSDAFSRWVAADYAFNVEHLRFGAGLLAISPDLRACRILGEHLRVNQATIDLLMDTAGRHDVCLDVEPGPMTLGLSSYLRSLLPHGYEVSITALYCAERVYFDAWSAVAPRASEAAPYWPLIEHLCSNESKNDLDAIGTLVDDIAAGPSGEMKIAFELIVRFELLFWSEVFVGSSW